MIGIVLFIAVVFLLSVMIYKKKKGNNAVDPKVTINNIIIASFFCGIFVYTQY